MRSRLSVSSFIRGVCVLFALLLSACVDAEEGPIAVLVAPETGGALLFSEELATIPRLLTDHGLSVEGAVEMEGWRSSWDMDGEAGAQMRSEVHTLAARRLVPVLGATGARDVISSNAGHISSTRELGGLLESDAIHGALESATGLHRRAAEALSKGEVEVALELSLAAADALWEVSPRQVAADLIEKADEALGRNPGPDAYSQEELIRVRRLMYGASEAVEAGDYPRAIRRAYYACQLLGANPP
ncbi:MAG: hypothetical protein HKO65_16600 [Gemmatimonadetes bacterium]|nr:hypothetical protein [Gemmatimonadota bacterium]NNM06716.1 hypothetical protein [Gemmatimonadota bacterium]